MPGPLSRFLSSKDAPPNNLDLVSQAMDQKWDIEPDQLRRVKDALVAIASDRRQPSRATKAARVLQSGIADDRRNRVEMLKLALADQALEERPAAIRNQVNIGASPLSLEQVHELLGQFSLPPIEATPIAPEELRPDVEPIS